MADLYHGAVIDIDGMLDANQLTKLQWVNFNLEISLPQNEQLTYSCRAKHVTGQKFYNMSVRDLFYISPGRRPNSIFAYRQTGTSNVIKLIFYVENFDFARIRPSSRSETEIRRF